MPLLCRKTIDIKFILDLFDWLVSDHLSVPSSIAMNSEFNKFEGIMTELLHYETGNSILTSFVVTDVS